MVENSISVDQGASPSAMRKFWVIFAPILVLAFFGAALWIVIKLNEKPEQRRRPFNTLAVMSKYAVQDDVQLSVTAQGESRPQTEIDLVPEIQGKIVYVSPNFIEGGIFKKGETLIRIEDADAKVAVIRAQAGVAQAEQALVREIAEGEVARLDYAELGRGTPTDLALRLPQRQQAEASLLSANAELDAMKLQLTRTSVKAPFSGRVISKSSDVGQYVSPGRTLGRIFSNDIVEVRLALTDADLAKLELPFAFVSRDRKTAPKVKLSTVIAGQTRTWDGNIMRTDSVYDTQTRSLFVIAEVHDPYGEGMSEDGYPLAPGLFVTATLDGKSYEDVITFPRDGLRPDNKVYTVDSNGQAYIKTVSVLDTTPDTAYITGGVEAGELIVLSPMEPSRTAVPLKAFDIDDPTKILVDPKPTAKPKTETAQTEKKSIFPWKNKKDAPESTSDSEKNNRGQDSHKNVAGGTSPSTGGGR